MAILFITSVFHKVFPCMIRIMLLVIDQSRRARMVLLTENVTTALRKHKVYQIIWVGHSAVDFLR